MKRLATAVVAALIVVGCTDGAPSAEASSGALDGAALPAEVGRPDGESAHTPTVADRAAILGTIQALFNALATADGPAIRDIMHPDVVMHSVERSGDGTRSSSTSTLDQLVARVEGSEAVLTERMFDPEVRVSGDLATVWTPYDFYVGDEFSHCGTDAVLLSRSGDSWTIVALSWTRLQPPECELHPDGPPE